MNKGNSDIFFSTRDELTKVRLDDVLFVVSDGNYIKLTFRSGRTVTLLASLQNFIQSISDMTDYHFERIGKSYIVNMDYVTQINTLRRTVVLVDDTVNKRIELTVSKEAIRALKAAVMAVPKSVISDFKTSNGNMEAFRVIK